MLPAGVIERIDTKDEQVFVDRTKDEIKSAPEFDEASIATPATASSSADYYGGFYS